MAEEQEVPGPAGEDEGAKEAAAAAAAEKATAEEAKETEVKPEPTPEETAAEEARKKHNREQAERRMDRKRLRDLEIENARLKGFQEGVQKAGGKTEHEDTAQAEAALEAEYARQHPEPKEDSFKIFADYNKAHTRWIVGLERHIESQRDDARQQRQEAPEATRVQDILKTGTEKHEDFEEAVYNIRDAGGLTDIMRLSLLEAANSADIMHHLGTDIKEFERIQKLSPSRQAAAIAALDDKFAAKPQIKKDLPPPPATVQGGGGGPGKNVFAENISENDRITLIRKNRAARMAGR